MKEKVFMQTLEITRICEDRTIKKVRSCLVCTLFANYDFFFVRINNVCV